MVLKTTLCKFSGLRIYPGRGVQYVQKDGTVSLFLSAKTRRMFLQRQKAANLSWTVTYRKLHKKDQAGEATKRKRRNTNARRPRAIVGASMEEIQKKRSERPDVRQKARELAVREIKDRMKKAKAAKPAANAAGRGPAPAKGPTHQKGPTSKPLPGKK